MLTVSSSFAPSPCFWKGGNTSIWLILGLICSYKLILMWVYTWTEIYRSQALINPSIRIENLPDRHNIDKQWCIQQQHTDCFPRWFYNVQTYLIKILILGLFLNENFQTFWRNSCAWLILSSIFYHCLTAKRISSCHHHRLYMTPHQWKT